MLFLYSLDRQLLGRISFELYRDITPKNLQKLQLYILEKKSSDIKNSLSIQLFLNLWFKEEISLHIMVLGVNQFTEIN